MSTEVYAFTEAFDVPIIHALYLRKASRWLIPISMHTDSRQVSDMITKGKRPSEKRRAIDFMLAWLAYQGFDTDKGSLRKVHDDYTSALNKMEENRKRNEILETGANNTTMQEWIARRAATVLIRLKVFEVMQILVSSWSCYLAVIVRFKCAFQVN